MAIARRTAGAGIPASTAATTSVSSSIAPSSSGSSASTPASSLARRSTRSTAARSSRLGRLHPPERIAIQASRRGTRAAPPTTRATPGSARAETVVVEHRAEYEGDHREQVRDEARSRAADSPDQRGHQGEGDPRAEDPEDRKGEAAPHPKPLRINPQIPNGDVQIVARASTLDITATEPYRCWTPR